MRVLFCTTTFSNVTNGPSRFARQLFKAGEHAATPEIRILTEDLLPGSVHNRLFHLPLKIPAIARSFGFAYRMFPYAAACKRVHRQYPYDVVVFNNAIIGIWAAILLPQPVVGMINDYSGMSVNIQSSAGVYQFIRKLTFHFLESLACKIQRGQIVNSRFMQKKINAIYRISDSRIKLVYKGIDSATPLSPYSPPDLKRPIKILFLKADFYRGGLYDLSDALKLLTKYRFELTIAGPDAHYRSTLESRCRAKHVSVRFPDIIPNEHIFTFMKCHHFLIVPSKSEALGVANMEALMAGLPVITTSVGGIPEVMDGDRNGWISPHSAPSRLAEVIRSALESPEQTSQKRVNGHQFITENFCFQQTLQSFTAALKSLCV